LDGALFKRWHDARQSPNWSAKPDLGDHRYRLGLLDPLQHYASHSNFLDHAYHVLQALRRSRAVAAPSGARAPNLQTIPLWLAAAYAQLGQIADARAEAAGVMRIKPAFRNHRPSEDQRMRSISSTGCANRGYRNVETQSHR
jgi:hypothetical protein